MLPSSNSLCRDFIALTRVHNLEVTSARSLVTSRANSRMASPNRAVRSRRAWFAFPVNMQAMDRVIPSFSLHFISRSLALFRRAESLELSPSLLQVIVDDDSVVHARGLRVSDLVLGLLQTGQNRLLAVGSAAAQPLLQYLDRRRLQEEEASIEIGLLHLLDALGKITNKSQQNAPSKTRPFHQHPTPLPPRPSRKLTSISISKIQTLPLSLTSLTACTLVP